MPWTSPFSLPGRWLKCGLHVHTTQSDGRVSPQEALARYRREGFDVVALTDHWVLTPGRSAAPPDDMITISGTEVDGPGYHLLVLGATGLPDRALQSDAQAMANAVREAGGICFLAHPYWTVKQPADPPLLSGLAGVEVYNAVCEQEEGLGHARVHWDSLLSRGARLGAIAVDDIHWKEGERIEGFTMVRAASTSESDILNALQAGHCYASSGPLIADLRLVRLEKGQPALKVQASPCVEITYYAAGPFGKRFRAEPGRTLSSAVLPLRREQRYLRVECRDACGGTAWSNPLYLDDVLPESSA